LSGTFEVFRKENINMLLGQSFPATLGATAPAANIGEFENMGMGRYPGPGRTG